MRFVFIVLLLYGSNISFCQEVSLNDIVFEGIVNKDGYIEDSEGFVKLFSEEKNDITKIFWVKLEKNDRKEREFWIKRFEYKKDKSGNKILSFYVLNCEDKTFNVYNIIKYDLDGNVEYSVNNNGIDNYRVIPGTGMVLVMEYICK